MSKIFIIAEAGVNHNGSIGIAKRLIDVAADAGADAVKFQTFISEKSVSTYAEKAEYQKIQTDSNESQLEMVKKLELSFEEFIMLSEYCKLKNILFLSTPFDLDSVQFLNEQINVPLFKIPSGEITNGPLILEIARTQKDVILSTGMSTLEDIENALAVLYYGYTCPTKTPTSFEEIVNNYKDSDKEVVSQKVTILHCTTEYPAPFNELNLKAIQTIKDMFNTKVGFSDHSEGILASIAAVVLGATTIEKHFTLDKNFEGPDHKASLEPFELKEMIKSIRMIEQSLGDGKKILAKSEVKNLVIARKSLVANKEIKKGELFTEENVTTKRPGHGRKPLQYWEVIGEKAEKNYERDEIL